MRFRFRLQTVYDLRQHEEEEQKNALSRARGRLAELEAAERSLRSDKDQWSRRYMEGAQAGFLPQEAACIGGYLEDLELRIGQAAHGREQQAAVVERERLVLISRMQARKTLEKLRGRQFERFSYDEQRKTEKEIEELIVSRRGGA